MMLELGTYVDSPNTPCLVDLARLLETRMLLTANSGQGKSRALRRLFEQAAGQIQQIIIDIEGEFASLREKHDLIICAAQGGDVVLHHRTAALLARRLRETKVSAVLDFSDLHARDRRHTARVFLEGLIECPRALWEPVLLAVDEAQVLAPEKGHAESEALDAMIDAATRGRKRGICVVAATLRISAFNKDVAAELKNRLVGGTVQDLDVKRLAFDLGMTPKDALAALRDLEPGHFLAYGPALHQKTPRELVTGPVFTTHPEPGKRRLTAPPKPTKAILALLPKLADLPKEAETEARTMEDLRRELSNTRRELTHARNATTTGTATAASVADLRAAQTAIKRLKDTIEALMKFVIQVNAVGFAKDAGVDAEALRKAIDAAVRQAMKLVDERLATRE